MIIVLLWLGLSVAIAAMADVRGRNGFLWFFISIVITPGGAFPLLLMSRDLRSSVRLQTAALQDGGLKKSCPRCGGQLDMDAANCPACGHDFALRTAPASCPLDPFALARKNEAALRVALGKCTGAELMRIIADCHMDIDVHVLRWSWDDVIEHIVREARKQVRAELATAASPAA